jgi:hypothetical protein
MSDSAIDQFSNVIAVERYFCWCFRLHWTIGRIARQTDLRQLGVIIARHHIINGFRSCPRLQIGVHTPSYQHRSSPPVKTDHYSTSAARPDDSSVMMRTRLPDSIERIVPSWDTANKATELSDFSVCATWGVRGKDLFVLGVFR